MKNIFIRGLSGTLMLALLPANSVIAQTGTTATIEEVLVTGRKREESLTDVPVSISVFNITALEDQGIASQDDLFAATVGLNYTSNTGDRTGNRPGVRGVQSELTASNQQKVTSFIDGLPMVGSQGNLQFTGIEAVEVYRGPQSAAFGRSTFAGAINYVTSDSAEEFTGKLMLNGTDLGGQQVGVMLSGPITDSLGYRVSYVSNEWDGPDEWTATDGNKLGSQKDDAITAKLNFEFSETAYGELLFSRTDSVDIAGPIWHTDMTSCSHTGSGIQRTSMGVALELPGDTWDCDTDVPAAGIGRNADLLGQFESYYGANRAAYEGTFMGGFAALDTDMNGELSASEYLGQRLPDGQTYEQALLGKTVLEPGTERDNTRLQGELNFEIGDSLLQFFGMHAEDNELFWNENDNNGLVAGFAVSMMTGQAALSGHIMAMYVPRAKEEDYVEVRWVSPEAERLRYTLSGSYYNYSASEQTNNNGGALVFGLVIDDPGGPNDGIAVSSEPGIIVSEIANNIGASVGVQYDLTDRTTLSFESRYQVDEICGIDANGPNVERCQETTSFLPRLSVNTNISDEMSVYGQVSIGNNPAGVNIAFQDPSLIQTLQIASGEIAVPALATNGVTVPINAGVIYNGEGGNPAPTISYGADTFADFEEEEITNYEIGIKGSFAERRGAFTAAAYFMDYKNMIGAENLDWDDLTDAAGAVLGGWNEGNWNGSSSTRAWINQGDGEMYGIEVTADYAIDDMWTVGGYVTLSSAKYADFCSIQAPEHTFIADGSSVLPILTPAADGVSSNCGVVDGNWIPQQTPFTANFNVSASLPNDLFGLRTSLRADVRHKGSYYIDQLNLLERDPVTTVNISANMRSESWTIRLFVDNLTDNQQPHRVFANNSYSLDPLAPAAVAASSPAWAIVGSRPREMGLQLQYSF